MYMQLSLSEYACQDNANPSSLNSFDIILSNDMLVSFLLLFLLSLGHLFTKHVYQLFTLPEQGRSVHRTAVHGLGIGLPKALYQTTFYAVSPFR